MEVTLSDGRKATFICDLTKELAKVRLEDGREIPYPLFKLKPNEPESQEEELKIVEVPAIDRLEELNKDYQRLVFAGVIEANYDFTEIVRLRDELRAEAIQEFKQKWGL